MEGALLAGLCLCLACCAVLCLVPTHLHWTLTPALRGLQIRGQQTGVYNVTSPFAGTACHNCHCIVTQRAIFQRPLATRGNTCHTTYRPATLTLSHRLPVASCLLLSSQLSCTPHTRARLHASPSNPKAATLGGRMPAIPHATSPTHAHPADAAALHTHTQVKPAAT